MLSLNEFEFIVKELDVRYHISNIVNWQGYVHGVTVMGKYYIESAEALTMTAACSLALMQYLDRLPSQEKEKVLAKVKELKGTNNV